jgi:2'-5' RNA ligase
MMARDRASRNEAKPLRLFVAVEVPEDAKRVVAEAVAPWREEFPRARWAPLENWHVTLKFLGSTWPRLMEWVMETVRDVAVRAAPFESRLSGLGSFPSPRRARVVWAGLDDGAGAMAGIAGALDEALAREFRAERRAFRPHLTVARSDPPLRLPESFGDSVLEAEPFTVGRLVLFRSHLRRPAPRYEPLQSFPLGQG